MRVVIIGCEYTGTTTLAVGIHDWSHVAMDNGIPIVHDHWKVPQTWGHPSGTTQLKGMTKDEQAQVMAMSPRLKEMYQRQSLFYHTSPEKVPDQHRLMVGLHIEDAIYAPLFFNYGIPNEFDVDRRVVMRIVEEHMLEFQSDWTLVLLKADRDVIARRLRENPHEPSVIAERDIELVSRRFDEEYEASRFRNKLALDTSNSTPESTLKEFLENFEPHFNEADRISMLVQRSKKAGDWI